jgi:hypothetical protein
VSTEALVLEPGARARNASRLAARLDGWFDRLDRGTGRANSATPGRNPAPLDASGPGEGDAFAALVAAFGLSPLEADLLLAAAASQLDGRIASRVAALEPGLSEGSPTLELALRLLAPEPELRLLALDALTPGRPLRRFRLVVVGDGPDDPRPLMLRPLGTDSRITDYLRGYDRLDELLAGVVRPLPPALVAPAHDHLVGEVAGALGARTAWPVINLLGDPEMGTRDLAVAAAERAGWNLLELDVASLERAGPMALLDLLAVIAREAVLSRIALLVDTSAIGEAGPSDPRPLVRQVIERASAPVVVISRQRWPIDGGATVVQVPAVDAAGRDGLWHRALVETPNSLNGELAQIAEQFDLGPAGIRRAILAAVSRLPEPALRPLGPAELWAACRVESGAELDGLARRLESEARWSDLVLPADALDQLHEIVAQVAARPLVYEGWGFGTGLGRRRGIAALFAGPSGTGKTLAAEIIANELHLDLYRVDLAAIVSKYIGETEKNLRRVFDQVDRAGVVVLFDEADALFSSRPEAVRDSHDRYAGIEVNYLLQRMEEHRGFAILATNRKDVIDPAFLRRLRFVIDFPFPGLEERRRLWQTAFPPEAARGDFDLAALARLELTGASIHAIALNAAFLAAASGGSIESDHVLRAARRELAKLGRPITAAEFGPLARVAR